MWWQLKWTLVDWDYRKLSSVHNKLHWALATDSCSYEREADVCYNEKHGKSKQNKKSTKNMCFHFEVFFCGFLDFFNGIIEVPWFLPGNFSCFLESLPSIILMIHYIGKSIGTPPYN